MCDGKDRNGKKEKSEMEGIEKEEVEMRDSHGVEQFAKHSCCMESPL